MIIYKIQTYVSIFTTFKLQSNNFLHVKEKTFSLKKVIKQLTFFSKFAKKLSIALYSLDKKTSVCESIVEYFTRIKKNSTRSIKRSSYNKSPFCEK